MDLQTSFQLLGLDPQASAEKVKRAYKSQVRRWHPDQFPEGSSTKIDAEERLKQINIAYSRIKAYFASRPPDPDTPSAGDSPPPPEANRDQASPGDQSTRRSWVDHLFESLNTFAGHTGRESQQPSNDRQPSARRKRFDQVLDEMTGGEIPSSSIHRRTNSAAAGRRTASLYTRYRRPGGNVGAVGGTESTGPVKPVRRVRGIGRSH